MIGAMIGPRGMIMGVTHPMIPLNTKHTRIRAWKTVVMVIMGPITGDRDRDSLTQNIFFLFWLHIANHDREIRHDHT